VARRDHEADNGGEDGQRHHTRLHQHDEIGQARRQRDHAGHVGRGRGIATVFMVNSPCARSMSSRGSKKGMSRVARPIARGMQGACLECCRPLRAGRERHSQSLSALHLGLGRSVRLPATRGGKITGCWKTRSSMRCRWSAAPVMVVRGYSPPPSPGHRGLCGSALSGRCRP